MNITVNQYGKRIEGTIENVVRTITEEVLRRKHNSGDNNKYPAKQLYEIVLETLSEIDNMNNDIKKITLDTFSIYVSKASSDSESNIYSERQGYYYRQNISRIDKESEINDLTGNKRTVRKIKRIEHLLYPVIAKYYADSEDYKVKITANCRSRNCFKYSVPDVLAAKLHEFSNMSEIELLAIEVKASRESADVEALLQTLNYTLFADKAILAYAVSQSEFRKRNVYHRMHCSKFNTGLVQIVFQDDVYECFINGELDEINQSDVQIYEIYQPRLSEISLSDRELLLGMLDVTKASQLNDWSL